MAKRWLITGASGQLGGHVLRRLRSDHPTDGLTAVIGPRRPAEAGAVAVDLADEVRLRDAIRAAAPTHVIHIAAMTSVADCVADPAAAARLNTDATRVIAEECSARGARLIFTSTDMVFDGTQAPYRSTDPTTPVSVYGRSKAAAEKVVQHTPRALVVRLPLMFGLPVGSRSTTFVQQLQALRDRKPLNLFSDEFRTPIWLADAAAALIGLALSDNVGVIHVAGPERLSRLALIERTAALLGIDTPALVPVSRLSIAGPEPRPADLSLVGDEFNAQFPRLAPRPLSRDMLSA